MLFKTAVGLLAAAAAAIASGPPKRRTGGWVLRYTATPVAKVAAAAATAKTSSPVSHVRGKAFDRFVIIYFENRNYAKAYGD
ncbi:hypothetical protein E4U53_000812, partial [Claviceps sorghi]